jgi:hypothetical protein
MRDSVRLSLLLMGFWSLQAVSQESTKSEATEKVEEPTAHGWNGQLPMAPAPPAPVVGTFIYFDFSPQIILADDCRHDVRERGAYRSYFNDGTFAGSERCGDAGRSSRMPTENPHQLPR